MSGDTPRTDAYEEKMLFEGLADSFRVRNIFDTMRDLERELADAISHTSFYRETAKRLKLERDDAQASESIAQLAMERLRAYAELLARTAAEFEAPLSYWCDGPERDALRAALAKNPHAVADTSKPSLRDVRENLAEDSGSAAAAGTLCVHETGRDWTEDAKYENGGYQNQCVECGEFFIGHKRRHVCKLCVAAYSGSCHQSCTQGTFADGMRHAASIVEDFRQSTEEGDTLAMVIEAIQKETGVHQVCNVPEGWKLVPVKMTTGMLMAGKLTDTVAERYAAQLAAAPEFENVACNQQEKP